MIITDNNTIQWSLTTVPCHWYPAESQEQILHSPLPTSSYLLHVSTIKQHWNTMPSHTNLYKKTTPYTIMTTGNEPAVYNSHTDMNLINKFPLITALYVPWWIYLCSHKPMTRPGHQETSKTPVNQQLTREHQYPPSQHLVSTSSMTIDTRATSNAYINIGQNTYIIISMCN